MYIESLKNKYTPTGDGFVHFGRFCFLKCVYTYTARLFEKEKFSV